MLCPHCRKRTSSLALKCAHCSCEVTQARTEGARTPIRCPCCESAVDVLWLGELEVDRCRACSGIWLDAGELKAFRALADDAGMQEGVRAALEEMRKPAPRSTKTYLPCPVCLTPMSRRNYADVYSLTLDHCRTHGTWLDHDDAVRLFELVASGDDERLRAMADRNRHQALQRQVSALEATVAGQTERLQRTERFHWIYLFVDLFVD